MNSAILDKAKQVVNEREMRHGYPTNNLLQISRLWGDYLKQGITPEDVAIMMIMLKCVRLRNDPTNIDSWVDIAGYAEIGCRCTMAEDAALSNVMKKHNEWVNKENDEDDIFS